MKKILIIDKINRCPRCNELMERRKHTRFTGKQMFNKNYFTEWDCCTHCNFVQLYEEFRKPITEEVLKEKALTIKLDTIPLF